MEFPPVRRMARPSPETFQRHAVEAGVPVVLEGALDAWAAPRRWSPRRLSARCGAVMVRVSVGSGRVFGVDPGRDRRVREMRFGDYLDHLGRQSGPAPELYLQKYPLHHFPGLARDLGDLPWLAGRRLFETALWVGGGGSVTPLHFDLTEGLLAQVRGRKRVVLLEPALDPLDPHPFWSRAPHFSRVDPEAADPSSARRLSGLRAFACELRAGELLYIPSPWWHQVTSLEPFNVSVNYWWIPSLRRAARYWNHTLRTLQMEAWRRLRHGGGLPGERAARRRARAA